MSDPSFSPQAQANGYQITGGPHASPNYEQPTPPPGGGYSAPPAQYYPAPYGAGYGAHGGYPVQRSNNTMAIVSMCLSIASFIFLGFVGSIPGVILGHIARRQVADPTRADNLGGGMATAGIIIGWINIGLWIAGIVVYIVFLVVVVAIAGSAGSI